MGQLTGEQFDDGREEEVLEYVQRHFNTSTFNKTESVISLIDEYAVKHKYLMNIGAEKGKIVTDLIAEHKPKIMLEFGSYIGYSTILFASTLKAAGGKQYISFEREPKFAKVAKGLVDLAGLDDVVKFVVGPSSQNIVAEVGAKTLTTADMIFFDHYKPAYVRDLKICESLGLIKDGTVLAADNVITPGNPTYLEYVRSSPEEKRGGLVVDSRESHVSNAQFPDRAVNQYKSYDENDVELPGNPDLVYQSRLVPGHEPSGEEDGVEVTICAGSLSSEAKQAVAID